MAFIQIGFFSNALGLCVNCDVILPQIPDAKEKFPVLWLLHGAAGDHTNWQRRTSIERYVDSLKMAVVMPAVQLSSYANMAYGGKFYDYVAKELPEKMRMFFPISERREDNFIAGLSMGGEGCMKIGLANPEHYAAIGCFSAGANNFGANRELTPDMEKRRFMIFGNRDLAGTEEDPFFQARNIVAKGLPAPRIYHAIGTEDFLLSQAHETRDFFQSIPGDPFGYTYQEFPGAHTWDFWDARVQDFLAFLQNEGLLRA